MRLTLGFAILLLSSISGCTQNATFDMTIKTPARPVGYERLHMVVAARRQNDFHLGWSGADLPETFELLDSPGTYALSLVTQDFADDAFIKISFCVAPTCGALAGAEHPADPQSEIWVSLTHPFYLAERTRFELNIDRFPECEDSSCDQVSSPPTSLGRACTNMPPSEDARQLSHPIWSCQIQRCEVICGSTAGEQSGGSCDTGRDEGVPGSAGPHLCDHS